MMGNRFRDEVVLISNKKENIYPEKFSNEIYFAENFSPKKSDPSFSYISNFTVKYTIKGQGQYSVNGKTKKVRQNQMLTINEGSLVNPLFAEGTGFSIFVEPNIIKDCLDSISKPNFQFQTQDILEYSHNFYDDVNYSKLKTIEELFNKLSRYKNLIIPTDFYYEIASELLLCDEHIKQKINQISSLKYSTKLEIYKRLEIAKHFLLNSLNGKFDLETLSSISCISKFHLIRLFKQTYGITPHRFFIREKINSIKNVIQQEPNKSLTDISVDFGYSNLYVFSKQFKAIYGVSPREYKKSLS